MEECRPGCEGLRGLCREAVWGRAPLHPASCVPAQPSLGRKRKEAEGNQSSRLSEEFLSSRLRFLCGEGSVGLRPLGEHEGTS